MPEIPATQKVQIGRIAVQGQPGQKVRAIPILAQKAGVVVCSCNPRYAGGKSRRIRVQAGPGKKHERLPEK
jgi:hypothetical protein